MIKFLNVTESASNLQTLNSILDTEMELRVDFTNALDRSAALAQLIVSLIGSEQLTFLWIKEFGTWPSLENWNLFEALCVASGAGDKTLPEWPGREFGPDELDEMISHLQVLLLNGWGGVLVGCKNRQRIAISHDSWLSIKPSSEISAQKQKVDEFGLSSRMERAPTSLVAVQTD